MIKRQYLCSYEVTLEPGKILKGWLTFTCRRWPWQEINFLEVREAVYDTAECDPDLPVIIVSLNRL